MSETKLLIWKLVGFELFAGLALMVLGAAFSAAQIITVGIACLVVGAPLLLLMIAFAR